MKRGRVLSLLVAGLLLLSACAPKEAAAPKPALYAGTPEADMVTIDIIAEPAGLNHLLLADGISTDVLRLCVAGLVKLDQHDQPQPDLAERWEVSADQRTYTFYLRKDAQWQNGDPVTAQDYAFAWMTQMTEETVSNYSYLLCESIQNGQAFFDKAVGPEELGVRVIDDYTLEVTFAQAMPYALHLLSMSCFGPVNQRAYEEIGPLAYGTDADKLVGNGPYEIVEWKHDESILLQKSESYYGKDAIGIPKVKLVMISDQNTRLNAFKTGQLDVCNLSGDQIEQLTAQSPEVVNRYIDNSTWFFRFNTQHEVLSNGNMRRALGYAVDTQSLLDYVIKDGSVAADGLTPGTIVGVEGKPYGEARGDLFGYDVQAAKAYLAKGLAELGKTPETLGLELICSDSSYGQTQALYLQQQWKENLGLEVTLRPLPWKAHIAAEQDGDFQITTVGWGPDYNDAMTYLSLFTSSNPNNHGHYENATYDALLEQAKTESDFAKRQALMIEAETILIDEMGIAPMYFTSTAYATSRKLTGLTRTGFQPFDLCDGAAIVPVT